MGDNLKKGPSELSTAKGRSNASRYSSTTTSRYTSKTSRGSSPTSRYSTSSLTKKRGALKKGRKKRSKATVTARIPVSKKSMVHSSSTEGNNEKKKDRYAKDSSSSYTSSSMTTSLTSKKVSTRRKKKSKKKLSDGSKGTIPVTPKKTLDLSNVYPTTRGTQRFIERKTCDEVLPFYHGLLPREDVNQLLCMDGDFLVRTTLIKSGTDRQKVLSVMWKNALRHFIFNTNKDGLYSLDFNASQAMTFPTIKELISYYYDGKRAFSTQVVAEVLLQKPIERTKWEFRHHQVEIGDLLGEGAFGEVYAGILHRKGKLVDVAIKMLKCEKLNKEKIEEAMKETRLLRSLHHRNIVRLYGVAADEEPLMILLELVKGGSLDKYLIKYNSKIKKSKRAKMALHASLGVQYLSTQGILHRDIAARNCLYTKGLLKLSDFGLSRSGPVVESLSTERVPVRWVAPEVFTKRQSTHFSDIWSLGVLIWEIYNNGQVPYGAMTPAQVKIAVLNDNFVLPMPEWCDETIKELVKKILVTDPAQRLPINKIVEMLESTLE